MNSIPCPYCSEKTTVEDSCTEEDIWNEIQCNFCNKNFTFTTVISFDYYPHKSDCLNGSDHKLISTWTHPIEFTRMSCSDCDYTRFPTTEEWVLIYEKRKKNGSS